MHKAAVSTWLTLLALGSGAPVAGAPPIVPPPPQTVTIAGDWTLTCRDGCAAATSVRSTQAGRELLRVSVTAAGGGQLSIFTALPLYLPDAAILTLGETEPRSIAWLTCRATGCEARVPLIAELLRDLRRERAGSVALTLLDGSRVRLGVSLLGSAAAFDALGLSSDP